jgi:hypothetical protein
MELLVPPLVPSAGELAMELLFWEGAARVSASSSKSGRIEEWELATGVGAFYNDLATNGGRLRWYFESPAHAGGLTPSSYVIPVVAVNRLSPPVPLPGLDCGVPVDFDPFDPFTYTLISWWGLLPVTWRSPYTPFSNAITVTPWVEVPASAALKGVAFYVGAVTIASNGVPFQVTNIVATELH